MLVHACNPSTWKVRAGGSRIQGHPEVHCKFEASLGHMKPSPKNQNKTKTKTKTKQKTKQNKKPTPHKQTKNPIHWKITVNNSCQGTKPQLQYTYN